MTKNFSEAHCHMAVALLCIYKVVLRVLFVLGLITQASCMQKMRHPVAMQTDD